MIKKTMRKEKSVRKGIKTREKKKHLPTIKTGMRKIGRFMLTKF